MRVIRWALRVWEVSKRQRLWISTGENCWITSKVYWENVKYEGGAEWRASSDRVFCCTSQICCSRLFLFLFFFITFLAFLFDTQKKVHSNDLLWFTSAKVWDPLERFSLYFVCYLNLNYNFTVIRFAHIDLSSICEPNVKGSVPFKISVLFV